MGMKHPLLEVILGDLEEPQTYLHHLHGGVSVFHLAGARNSTETSPESHNRVNVEASIELGRASLQAHVSKFVYISSALVFGPSNGKNIIDENGSYEQEFGNSYLRSRVEALEQMKQLAEQGLPLLTVCPTIVFGPDHSTHPNRVTSHLRRLLRFRLDLVVAGGRHRRNLVYVDDVVRGILLAEQFGDVGEEFILGGENISHRELNRTALSLAGRPPRFSVSIPQGVALAGTKVADTISRRDRRSGYVAALGMLTTEWLYSSQKAQKRLGYTSLPIRDSLQKTLQFLESETP
jgi:nucleoside-diphosphate-sugar epimerase